jgi:hypothetical protein
MRTALGVTALATVFIGIFPNWFIQAVNWSLGLTPVAPVASLMR